MTWLLVIAMVALAGVALALLFWPLLASRRAEVVSRARLNAAIYRDQLDELARDRAAGTLTEQAYVQSSQELQRRALQDTAAGESTAPSAQRPTALLLTIGLLLPIGATLLYLWLGNPRAMLEQAAAPKFTASQVDEMVQRLAERMEKNPDDPKGWIMLARSYKALGRLELAEQAYGRIGPSLDQDPELLIDYAEVLARRAGGDFKGKPQELIARALKLDPDNMQALGLAGISAFSRQSYAEAADYLQRLLAKLPPDSEEAKTVAFTIDKARSMASISGVKPAGKSDTKADPGKAAAKAAGISGRVSLAPALAGSVTAGDTLFVFARAVEGPRIPLAILRTHAGALPLKFILDDSLSMDPQFRLSALPPGAQVHIEARISKSGEALPKPGDLVGDGGKVQPGAKSVEIVINRALP